MEQPLFPTIKSSANTNRIIRNILKAHQKACRKVRVEDLPSLIMSTKHLMNLIDDFSDPKIKIISENNSGRG